MTEEPSFAERILAEVNALLQRELESNRKEIRSLKGRLTKVSNRVDDINMLGFQDQIVALNKLIKGYLDTSLGETAALRETLLKVSRSSSLLRVQTMSNFMRHHLSHQASGDAQHNKILEECLQFLDRKAFSAAAYISTSDDPIRLAQDLANEVQTYFKQRGIDFFLPG